MGGGTLLVIQWAAQTYDETIARTMGMVTFTISNVAFSLATKDERNSVFSLDVLSDRPFIIATGVSILTIVLMTELGVLNRLLGTTSLTLDLWVACALVGLAIIPISEVRKRIWNVEAEEVPVVARSESLPVSA